jgi:predicted ATPase/DNA-binding SARP family transcriptional activator
MPAKELTLLAALAVSPGQVLSGDRLADAVWGEDPPVSAHNALQVYVSHLRRALGRDAVTSHGGAYSLALDPDEIDAERFGRLSDAGAHALREGDLERARQLLRAALGLWRGTPLGVLADRDWFRPHAERLIEARTVTLEHRIEADLASGYGLDLLGELEALAAEHPYREALHAARIRALYQAGRRADALSAFQGARSALVEDLGIEPGPDLQALHAAVLADSLTVQARSAARAAPVMRLPAAVTRLIGRERDLRDAVELLAADGVRCVTILGPGGVGKTAFALELARRVESLYEDGACWVPLGGVDDPEQVVPAVAGALGVLSGPAPLEEMVASTLRRRQLLLVVDNLEHLMPAAPALGRLLAAAPRLQLLLTSRVATRLNGEHRVPLAPLASVLDAGQAGQRTADPGIGPACALFLERAQAVRPDVHLIDPAQQAAIQAICTRLDGLPLAIELAAARTALLTPSALLARLDRRLSLLTTSTADAGPRHTSLRATLEWSVGLLGPPGRRLLSRLAVFRGAFTTEAAEAVGDHDGTLGEPALDALQELIDASLLTVDAGSHPADDCRLLMLETVREYAEDMPEYASDRDATQDAHAQHLAKALTQRWPGLPLYPRTHAEAEWLRRYEDDLRAALQWAQQRGRQDLLVELALLAAGHWDFTAQGQEALRWLSRASDDASTKAPRRADLAVWQAAITGHLGQLQASLDAARQALRYAEASGDLDRIGFTTATLAFCITRIEAPDADDTLKRCRQVEMGRVEDADARALARSFMAVAVYDRDPELGLQLARAAVRDARTAGELIKMVTASNLADALLVAGDIAGARRSAQAATAACSWSDRTGIRPYPLDLLGLAELHAGDPDAAEPALRESLQLGDWSGDAAFCAVSLRSHAALAAARGRYRLAVLLDAGHRHALQRLGAVEEGSGRVVADRLLRDAPKHVDARSRELLDVHAATLTLHELVTLALSADDQLEENLSCAVERWEGRWQLRSL